MDDLDELVRLTPLVFVTKELLVNMDSDRVRSSRLGADADWTVLSMFSDSHEVVFSRIMNARMLRNSSSVTLEDWFNPQ